MDESVLMDYRAIYTHGIAMRIMVLESNNINTINPPPPSGSPPPPLPFSSGYISDFFSTNMPPLTKHATVLVLFIVI